MRVSVTKKLAAGFGLVIALVAGLAGVVFYEAGVVRRTTDVALEENVPALELGTLLRGEIHHALSMHRGYMILGSKALADERIETWETIDAASAEMDVLAARWTDAALVQKWNDVKKTLAELRVAQDRIAAVAHTAADRPADKLFYETAAPFGDEMVRRLQAILDIEVGHEATPERKSLVRAVSEAEGHLLKSRYAIAAFLTSGLEEDLDRVNDCVNACAASVDRLRKQAGLFDEEQASHFDEYIAARAEFLRLAAEAVEIRGDAGFCVSEDICANDVTLLAVRADDAITEIIAAQREAKDASIAATKSANAKLVTVVAVTAGLAVLVGVAVSWFLSGQIVRALRAIASCTESIAERDLTGPELSVRTGDDFEALAASMNTMRAAIRDVLGEVSTVAEEVAAASEQVSRSSEAIAAGVGDQSQQVEQISSAVVELTASAKQVAEQSGEAAATADRSTSLATEGGDVVRRAVEGMNAISTSVGQSATSVAELGNRSEQIGEIIDVINEIAEQTNLLALNAAIEAARAGEHGRGFAVVADEVRKLAERTQVATEEVSRSVAAIQKETSVAVDRMEEGTAEVSRGVELAGRAGESLASIETGTREVTSLVRAISAAAAEQANAAESVSRGITKISSVAADTSRGTRETSLAASQLAERSDALRKLVQRFRL